MPFKKGQSGNPRGAAKPIKDLGEITHDKVVAIAKDMSPEALRLLGIIMRARRASWGARVTAANSVLARAWGQPVTYSAEEDAHRRDLDAISDEELAADIERLRRANNTAGTAATSGDQKKPH
jgi:hypothetical protein